MRLADRRPSQVTKESLEALIGVESESKYIEYKRSLPGKTDDAKREFLCDASSFANTEGGYLVFGIEEANGRATRLTGLPGINPDDEILRLEQMLRDGVRPPLTVETAAVLLDGGSVAIVMRISKSWNPPHQVTFQKAARFYASASNEKYQLDVDELRSVFLL